MAFFENDSGRILIDKPAGITSFGVVARIRRVLKDEFILGQISSTGDPEGEISKCENFEVPTFEQIEKEIKTNFLGKIEQTPPAFSAIKIDGRRAYDLARKGEDFEIPKRTVEIFDFEILSYDFPKLKVRTHVSSGTYIRSLAEDLGENLGCGAFCSQLRRTKIADFDISKAKKLEDFGILD